MCPFLEAERETQSERRAVSGARVQETDRSTASTRKNSGPDKSPQGPVDGGALSSLMEDYSSLSGPSEAKRQTPSVDHSATSADSQVQFAGGGEFAGAEAAYAGEGRSPGEVHSIASTGVSGATGAFPHMDVIGRSFGRFDISGVKAQVGGGATVANEQLGSTAYVTDNRAGFSSAPSLHTAAHEAAHIVQQRAGVQLKSGVGNRGDRHEQHADHVADRVVAGRSAEALLQQYAGGGSESAGGMVQFEEPDKKTKTDAPAAEKPVLVAPAKGAKSGAFRALNKTKIPKEEVGKTLREHFGSAKKIQKLAESLSSAQQYKSLKADVAAFAGQIGGNHIAILEEKSGFQLMLVKKGLVGADQRITFVKSLASSQLGGLVGMLSSGALETKEEKSIVIRAMVSSGNEKYVEVLENLAMSDDKSIQALATRAHTLLSNKVKGKKVEALEKKVSDLEGGKTPANEAKGEKVEAKEKTVTGGEGDLQDPKDAMVRQEQRTTQEATDRVQTQIQFFGRDVGAAVGLLINKIHIPKKVEHKKNWFEGIMDFFFNVATVLFPLVRGAGLIAKVAAGFAGKAAKTAQAAGKAAEAISKAQKPFDKWEVAKNAVLDVKDTAEGLGKMSESPKPKVMPHQDGADIKSTFVQALAFFRENDLAGYKDKLSVAGQGLVEQYYGQSSEEQKRQFLQPGGYRELSKVVLQRGIFTGGVGRRFITESGLLDADIKDYLFEKFTFVWNKSLAKSNAMELYNEGSDLQKLWVPGAASQDGMSYREAGDAMDGGAFGTTFESKRTNNDKIRDEDAAKAHIDFVQEKNFADLDKKWNVSTPEEHRETMIDLVAKGKRFHPQAMAKLANFSDVRQDKVVQRGATARVAEQKAEEKDPVKMLARAEQELAVHLGYTVEQWDRDAANRVLRKYEWHYNVPKENLEPLWKKYHDKSYSMNGELENLQRQIRNLLEEPIETWDEDKTRALMDKYGRCPSHVMLQHYELQFKMKQADKDEEYDPVLVDLRKKVAGELQAEYERAEARFKVKIKDYKPTGITLEDDLRAWGRDTRARVRSYHYDYQPKLPKKYMDKFSAEVEGKEREIMGWYRQQRTDCPRTEGGHGYGDPKRCDSSSN